MAASGLLNKGHKDGQVVLGNTLTDDPFPDHRFDYLLANPPFGVDWKARRRSSTAGPALGLGVGSDVGMELESRRAAGTRVNATEPKGSGTEGDAVAH